MSKNKSQESTLSKASDSASAKESREAAAHLAQEAREAEILRAIERARVKQEQEQAAREAKAAQELQNQNKKEGDKNQPTQGTKSDTVASAAETKLLPGIEITDSESKQVTPKSSKTDEIKYEVRKGDSVWNIAASALSAEGVKNSKNELIASKSEQIINRNGLNKNGRNADLIDSGETLTIPLKAKLSEKSNDGQKSQQESSLNLSKNKNNAQETESKREEASRTPEAVKVQERLDPKAIKLLTKDLSDALDKKTVFVNTPDSDKVIRLLSSRNAADYKDIESEFKKDRPETDLRKTLVERLSETDYRKAEAMLNSRDGRTNDAGNLQVGLTSAKTDKNAGQTQVLESVATLNSRQVEQLKTDFQSDYKEDYQARVSNSADLSSETKQAFSILSKGVDKRDASDVSTLVDLAMKTNDKELIKIALRGDAPETKSVRDSLNNNAAFQAKYKESFGDDQAAKDVLKDGRISISTIVSNDTGKVWFLNNKANVVSTLDQATDAERKNYSTGRNLALTKSGAQSDEDKSALEYYNKINGALNSGGNAREVSVWEDRLINKGGSIVSKLAQKQNNGWTDDGGWGSGHNTKELIAATQLTKKDWEDLNDPKTGRSLRSDLENSLKTYTTEKERKLILETIDKKAAVPFEQSAKVNPDILKHVEVTSVDGKPDGQIVAQSIGGLSPSEIEQYRNNTGGFKQNIDSIVKDLRGEELHFSKRVLNQVTTTGKIDIEGDPVAQVLKNSVDRVDTAKALTDYQKLIQDKDVLARLNKPDNEITAEDRLLKSILTRTVQGQAFNKGASANVAVATGEDVTKETLATGKIPVSAKLFLDLPHKGLISEVAQASEAERTKALKYLSDDEKQIVKNAVAQGGKTTLADDLRSFVNGDGSNYQSFENQLKELTPAQKQSLKSEYQTKYGSLDDQLISKVDQKDQAQFKKYLDPERSSDGRQDYYDNLRQRLKSQDGFSADGSGISVERASIVNAEELQKFQKQFKSLPVEEQDALNKQFSESISQYRESKGKLKDLVVDSTIAAAAIALAPTTGGITLTGYAYVATGGAAFRLAAGRVIEGKDFNDSPENVLKELVTGGATAATAFVGPEALLGLTKVGTVAAENTAKVLSTSGTSELLKQGGKEALEQNLKQVFGQAALTGKEITLQDLNKITGSVIKQNATEAEKQLLSQNIKSAFTKELKDESKRSLSESIEQYAKVQARESLNNGVVAGASNVAGEVIVAPFNKDGLNPEKLANSAFTGFAAGAVLPVVFKAGIHGAEATKDLVVNVTKGVDGHLYINPKNNGTLKIAHGEGGETTVQSGEGNPYRLKNGDTVVEGGVTPEKPLSQLKAEVRPVTDEYDPRRVLNVEGKDYSVRQLQPQWFYGNQTGEYKTPLKVHVTTNSAEDLGNLQKVLIPALSDDPEISKLATWWKTFDPLHGVGKSVDAAGDQPDGKGQLAKAFTIYAATPEDAVKLQAKIDSLLERKGLGIDTPHTTGNVDHVYGKSNRVGISFDTPSRVETAQGRGVAKIQNEVVDAIHKDFNVPAGEKFSPEQLNAIEKKAGIRNGTLVYSKDGELSLLPVAGDGKPYNSGIYITEGGADKTLGTMTDRPAYYQLARKYGFDPGEISGGLSSKR